MDPIGSFGNPTGLVWCGAMKSGLDPYFGPMSVPLVQNLGLDKWPEPLVWTLDLNPLFGPLAWTLGLDPSSGQPIEKHENKWHQLEVEGG